MTHWLLCTGEGKKSLFLIFLYILTELLAVIEHWGIIFKISVFNIPVYINRTFGRY